MQVLQAPFVRVLPYGSDFDALVRSGAIGTIEASETRQLASILLGGRCSAIIENPIAMAASDKALASIKADGG